MALLPFRNDTRLFGIVFVMFNILLAGYNILNYRITPRTTSPCVVIVAPTPSSLIKENKQLLRPRVPTITQNPHTLERLPSSHRLKHEVEKSDISRTTLQKDKVSASFYTPTAVSTALTDSSQTPHTRIVTTCANKTTSTTLNKTVESTVSIPWEFEVRGKYLVIKNYIPADMDPPGFNASVTLSTQGTYEFLNHVETLCSRWDGPVSVSVYAPGTDLAVAVRKILYLRQCGPSCVRTNVSWHMIYDSVLGPSITELTAPNDTAEMDVYGALVNCSGGTEALDLISDIRKSKKMPYPINVARNVARQQARTKYVLASDIELYPSLNIVTRFLKMVAKESEDTAKSKHVYTLPIFEIKKEFPPPKTKTELAHQMKSGHAIFFHKWICDSCQNFPKRDEWIKYIPENDTLSVFHVTKRQHPRTHWEPIYIGTNAEPLYDDRLTWDGKRDKMSQMYELCLMDYNFYILDNAFLVHAPGIKTMSRVDLQRRAPFMMRNNAIHNKLLAEMRKKYGVRKGC